MENLCLPKAPTLQNDDNSEMIYAVNDVYLARTTGQSANLRIDIDGVNVVEKLMCDGVIVATSLGSTAYSSSAGGSPCHPLLRRSCYQILFHLAHPASIFYGSSIFCR